MANFVKNGIVCFVNKDPHESLEQFSERGYFIVAQQPLTQKDYNLAVLYSRIYINKLYRKCGYNDNVENLLQQMMDNLG